MYPLLRKYLVTKVPFLRRKSFKDFCRNNLTLDLHKTNFTSKVSLKRVVITFRGKRVNRKDIEKTSEIERKKYLRLSA